VSVADGVVNGASDLAVIGLLLASASFTVAAWQTQRRIDKEAGALDAITAWESELELVRAAINRLDLALFEPAASAPPNSPPPAAAR
jgi:hypothetical protein